MSRRSIGLAVATLLALAACAPVTTRTTFPPLGTTPGPPGDATAATKQKLIDALSAKGLVATDTIRSFRPPEGPLLAAAPRSVIQVELTDDPDHGFIVIYALGSPDAAIAAAEDQLAYIARGEGGGALLPPGTNIVVRPRNSTVVFFHWLPATSPDPRTSTIADTIAEVTDGVRLTPSGPPTPD
jgi:hypothetical protein